MKQLQMLFISLVIMSCGKPDSKNLEEKVLREISVENLNIDKKAMALESDLERKQLFFTALEGTYEGAFTAGDKEFKTRITFIPSLPPYTANRIRTLDEITADLNNLYFSVQTTHWNSKGTAVAAGCIFSQMKPDFDNGQIVAAAENCPNVYKVSLYDSSGDANGDSPVSTSKILVNSKIISKKVFTKEVQRINELFIIIQPTLLAKTFVTTLKRVQP